MATKRKRKRINQLRGGGWVQGELMLEIVPGKYVLSGKLAEDAVECWVFTKVKYDPQSQTYVPLGVSLGGFYMRPQDIITELDIKDQITETGLYRLYHAGFIAGRRVTPNVLEIDIQSLADHFDKVRDPQFWTSERKRRYSDALL